jgi:propanediol dehydratase small subunit
VAEDFIKTAEQYKGLVADYNKLVEKYNGLLDTYRSNINGNMAFADQMKRILDAQASQCGTAIRDAMESYTPPAPSTYKPMVPTHCTAHTISNPITGNWTYMDCH